MTKKTSKKKSVTPTPDLEDLKSKEGTGDSLINLEDFDSVVLKFSIRNNTSGTTVDKSGAIQLVELGERDLILELPARVCQKGHNLMIEIESQKGTKTLIPFSANVKVDSVEKLTPDADKVQITLIQYDQVGWDRFRSLYSERQNEIEKFLTGARGY